MCHAEHLMFGFFSTQYLGDLALKLLIRFDLDFLTLSESFLPETLLYICSHL